MIVITLTNCPDALRGDLTKWLLEVNAGVFVGRVGARVRDRLWNRVSGHVREGRATMVFSAANEQRLDFRVANTEWTPIDLDGLKLILRPEPRQEESPADSLRPGYSKAARMLKARRMAAASGTRAARKGREHLTSYTVIDLETTGLSPEKDEIIEMSAIRIRDGREVESFNVLIRPTREVPLKIVELTGITEAMLREKGRNMEDSLNDFLNFAGEDTLVAHNAGFDMAFLNTACRRAGRPTVGNISVDTLGISKRSIGGLRSYSLKTMAEYFKFGPIVGLHRGIADCKMTKMLYEKLMKSM